MTENTAWIRRSGQNLCVCVCFCTQCVDAVQELSEDILFLQEVHRDLRQRCAELSSWLRGPAQFPNLPHTPTLLIDQYIDVNKLKASYVSHTDQWRYSGVAVDQRQPGQTDDDVAQGRCEESGVCTVSMVTQGKDTLQAFHQLRHDLTRLPL